MSRPNAGWAKVPKSIIESGIDPHCFMLFCHLDSYQGDRGWPVRGYDTVAQKLGWQARTVSIHATHLEERGLIEVEAERKSTGSWAKATMKVIANPVRNRGNPVSSEPARRYRSSSSAPDRFGGAQTDQDVSRPAHHVPSPDAVRGTRELVRETQEVPSICGAADAGRPRSAVRCGGEVCSVDSEQEVVPGRCRSCGGWPGADAPAGAPYCICEQPVMAFATRYTGNDDDVVAEF